MKRPSFYFWKWLTALFDIYAYLLNARHLRKFGIIERRPTPDIKKIVGSQEGSVESFYGSFGSNQDVGLRVAGYKQRADGLVESYLTFSSPFVSSSLENNTVRAVLYKNGEDVDKVIILVNGVFVSFNSADRYMARMLAGNGFDCCVMALPYHGPRRHPYLKSGLAFIAPDHFATAEAFIQSVLDCNKLHEILSSSFGYKEIYIVGFSVGGNAALVSSFMKEYGAVALIMAGIPPADTVWSIPMPYAVAVREKVNQHYSLDEVRNLWKMSDPRNFGSQPKNQKFLVLAGLFDWFKPKFTLNIREFLPGSEMIVYPASHASALLFMGPAVKNIQRFFRGQPVIQTPRRL